MSEGRAVLGEVAKLEAIQAELAAISRRKDAGRKQELVELRRELAVQIGAISTTAEKAYIPTANPDDARNFRSLLSAMRRATALHQANWPAVRLDEQDREYQESLVGVRAANTEFF